MYSFKQIKEDIFNFEGVEFETQGDFYEMYVDNLTFPKLYSEYFKQPLDLDKRMDCFIGNVKTFVEETKPYLKNNLKFTKTFAIFASENGVDLNMIAESDNPEKELDFNKIIGMPGKYVKVYLVGVHPGNLFGIAMLCELAPPTFH